MQCKSGKHILGHFYDIKLVKSKQWWGINTAERIIPTTSPAKVFTLTDNI